MTTHVSTHTWTAKWRYAEFATRDLYEKVLELTNQGITPTGIKIENDADNSGGFWQITITWKEEEHVANLHSAAIDEN